MIFIWTEQKKAIEILEVGKAIVGLRKNGKRPDTLLLTQSEAALIQSSDKIKNYYDRHVLPILVKGPNVIIIDAYRC